MRVLGIDPGLTRCGVGIIEGDPGRTPALLLADVVRTPAEMETGQRLASLERSLVQYLAEYRPHAIAVERVFARRDVSTIIGTAQASGVVLLVGTRAGLNVAQHTPSEAMPSRSTASASGVKLLSAVCSARPGRSCMGAREPRMPCTTIRLAAVPSRA